MHRFCSHTARSQATARINKGQKGQTNTPRKWHQGSTKAPPPSPPSLSLSPHREGVGRGDLGHESVRHPGGHRLHPLKYPLHPASQVSRVLNIPGKFPDPPDQGRRLLVLALQQELLQLFFWCWSVVVEKRKGGASGVRNGKRWREFQIRGSQGGRGRVGAEVSARAFCLSPRLRGSLKVAVPRPSVSRFG